MSTVQQPMPAAEQPRVTVYLTRRCGFCRLAVALLAARGIPFRAIDITDDPRARYDLIERTHWRTVPIVLIDGEVIGGHRELARLDASGELSRRATSDRAAAPAGVAPP